MTDELTAELLNAPDAQLIINRVQAVLNDEKNVGRNSMTGCRTM